MSRGKLTAEDLLEIRRSRASNRTLAKRFGVGHAYIGKIRRGEKKPVAERLATEDAAAKIQAVIGVAPLVVKRAKAGEDLLDCVLLCLDDLKKTTHMENRERRVSILARALRDVAESTEMLRKSRMLEEMTDDDVRRALAQSVDVPALPPAPAEVA